jgi:NADH-quinone oxidoreductase subunit L
MPLIVLAVLAASCAIGGEAGFLYKLLTYSEPSYIAEPVAGMGVVATTLPGHEATHAVHSTAGAYALLAAFTGTLIAWLVYGQRVLNPADVKRQLIGLHTFLAEKWWFDELYDAAFVKPVHIIASWCTAIDKYVIDGFLHAVSRFTLWLATIDRRFDEGVVDGFVNLLADSTYAVGRSLRSIQTGLLRQYIMFIAVSVVGLFVLLFAFYPRAEATPASVPEPPAAVSQVQRM